MHTIAGALLTDRACRADSPLSAFLHPLAHFRTTRRIFPLLNSFSFFPVIWEICLHPLFSLRFRIKLCLYLSLVFDDPLSEFRSPFQVDLRVHFGCLPRDRSIDRQFYSEKRGLRDSTPKRDTRCPHA